MIAVEAPPHETPADARPAVDLTASLLSVLWFAGLVAAGVASLLHAWLGYSLAVLYLCFVGVGSSVIVYVPRLSPAWRFTLSFATSAGLLILVSLLQAEIKWWHPVPVAAVLGALATLAHLVSLATAPHVVLRAIGAAQRALAGSSRRSFVAAGALVLATTVCLATAAADRSNEDVGYGGLLRSINPAWYLGLAALVLIAALTAASARRLLPPAIPVSAVGLVLTLTPAIVYAEPRSQSANKHVQLVELIQHGRGLSSSYAIYNGWGGFFSWIAWIDGVARITDVLALATFWPALLVLFRVAALRCLAGTLLPSAKACWSAVLIAVLADSIGADYFSPQAIGFVLAVIVFALAVSDLPKGLTLPVITLLAIALAPTHQLSPYLMCGALFWLLVFRIVKSWWTLVCAAVPTIVWTAMHHDVLGGYLSLDSIGSVSNFAPPSQRSDAHQQLIVKAAIYATVAALLVLVIAGAYLVLHERTRANWGLAFASSVGLTVVAVNAYGNEGIFRAVLFAIPWLAVLTVRSARSTPRMRIRRHAPVVVPLLLTATFLIGAFSLDGSTVTRRSDLAVIDQLTAYADQHRRHWFVVLTLDQGDIPVASPTAPRNLHFFRVAPEAVPTGHLTEADIVDFVNGARKYYEHALDPRAEIYLLNSPAAEIHDVQYGFATASTQRRVWRAFAASPLWEPSFGSGATRTLHLVLPTAGSTT